MPNQPLPIKRKISIAIPFLCAIIFTAIIFFSPKLFAQENKNQQIQSFESLNTMVINAKYNAIIHYDKALAEIINIPLGKLDQNDPLYTDEADHDDIKLMNVQIDNNTSEKYIIVFSYGPSLDPSFDIFSDYTKGEKAKLLASLSGWELFIPGNGFLYISGHTDNAFNQRKKFQLSNNSITEIKQPFYYVGLKSKTLKPIILYRTSDQQDVVANLPAGADIEVLIAETDYVENNKMNFLVKTSFGLVGWTRIEIVQSADIISGIFYAGD